MTIGEFDKPLKSHHHKSAIKKAYKHIVGTKPVKQKIVYPGTVPRNIGLYGEVNPAEAGSPEWYSEMDVLVKRYTGWDSLKHMCANRPTLRVSKGHSNLEASAIYVLRDAYKFVTGRESHPEENWDETKRGRR